MRGYWYDVCIAFALSSLVPVHLLGTCHHVSLGCIFLEFVTRLMIGTTQAVSFEFSFCIFFIIMYSFVIIFFIYVEQMKQLAE